ncbi:serine/threonine/tyrosine-interacting-like protein 1 isoform X3 [Lissotriton helveticus]
MPECSNRKTAGIVMCEPRELYNILNQSTKFSRLAEPNYLCLLDARSKRDYNESHVITAKFVNKEETGEFQLPKGVELECMKYCIVYDSNTVSLLDETVPAIQCAQVLEEVSRLPVRILMGGYERFSALYHFFRTQKVLWMPREIDEFQPYPLEILTVGLYLGDTRQANEPQIQKDLKIKAQVNVTEEPGIIHSSVPELLSARLLQPGDQPQLQCGDCLPHASAEEDPAGSLGPRPEMQTNYEAKPWLRAAAVAMGGGGPWSSHHRHLRPAVLGIVELLEKNTK